MSERLPVGSTLRHPDGDVVLVVSERDVVVLIGAASPENASIGSPGEIRSGWLGEGGWYHRVWSLVWRRLVLRTDGDDV